MIIFKANSTLRQLIFILNLIFFRVTTPLSHCLKLLQTRPLQSKLETAYRAQGIHLRVSRF